MADVGEESRLRRDEFIQGNRAIAFCRVCGRVRHRTGDLIGGEGEETTVVIVPRALGAHSRDENSARADSL